MMAISIFDLQHCKKINLSILNFLDLSTKHSKMFYIDFIWLKPSKYIKSNYTDWLQ